MDFNAAQMREDALIPEGKYKFRVKDAREKRSTTGNDMLSLRLALQVNNREVLEWDNLMLMPKMFWKIEHFCEATGLQAKLEEGRLMAQDCIGKEGYLYMVRKADAKTGEITNQVRDYCEPEPTINEFSEHIFVAPPTLDLNDDVPNFA
jgi:hypothetical protein